MIIEGIRKHQFVCSDTATRKLIWIDEEGKITREISGLDCVFDIWVLPDGRIVFPYYGGESGSGVYILSQDGRVDFQYRTEHEVFGCQPLENGNILVAELRQRRLVEVDMQGRIVVEIPVEYEGDPHECMRMARKIGNFYYVVQPGLNVIRKLSWTGECMKEYKIHQDAFGIVEKANGNLVYTCISGAYELDAEGREIWSLTQKDVPEMNIRWLLGIQLMSNGNLVLSNWMGHNHKDEGIHFFEVTPDKQIVWSCDSRGTLVEPATLQILDEDAYMTCYHPMK